VDASPTRIREPSSGYDHVDDSTAVGGAAVSRATAGCWPGTVSLTATAAARVVGAAGAAAPATAATSTARPSVTIAYAFTPPSG
jgi:hypothetical protein